MTVFILFQTGHIEKAAMLKIRFSIFCTSKIQAMAKRTWSHWGKRVTISHRLVKLQQERREKREKKEELETQEKNKEMIDLWINQ